MQRAKTFFILVAVHLALTVGAVWLALYAFVAGVSGARAQWLDALGNAAEAAVWMLGAPLLVAAWLADPGFWSTGRFLAVAALNSTVWVGSAVLLARWLHPGRPRLLTGVVPAVDLRR